MFPNIDETMSAMRPWIKLTAAICAAMAAVTSLHAQPPLEAAEQALAERLPGVAIEKLHDFLASQEAADDTLRQRAEDDLTRAMLDARDDAGALERLEYPANDRERFWKAEALSALGRWDEALPLYQQIAADGPADLWLAATLGMAEAQDQQATMDPQHAAIHLRQAISTLEAAVKKTDSNLARLRLTEIYLEAQDTTKAAAMFNAITPANLLQTRWKQFVEGRIYLDQDKAAGAMQDFQELLDDAHARGMTPALQAGATIGMTEARINLNWLEVADDVLENFIGHYPDSPYLDEMFRRLDAIYSKEENPSDVELQAWAAKAPPRRAALALYYEARSLQNQGRQEKAVRAYTQFVKLYPRHEFVFEAWMQLGQLYRETHRAPDAIASFEGAMRASTNEHDRARAEIATGNVSFAQGEFLLAQEHFHNASQRSADFWLQATYDSALAWLHMQNYDRFLEDYVPLSERYPETEERRTLLLEEGLLQARSRDARAAATLQTFIRDFSDNPRVGEARLALAELAYGDGDADNASNLLKTAYVMETTDQSRQQADYLAIFLADSAATRDDSGVIKLGQKFVADWPGSPLLPQVRMKLGQVYFRHEDFANAQTQFETLAQESPADPLADKALILAGQSAVHGMSSGGVQHALELFQRVAAGDGPLKLYARQEQALVKAQMGQNDDAVKLYDDILRSNPDASLRIASLCGKADCLVAGSGTDSITTAIGLYDQIITDPAVTAPWHDEALYKKAGCLARQGQGDKALAAYYDILNGSAGAAHELPDFFWYEKAGYDAEAMLEAKGQWAGAISLLEKIAAAGGPRSADARKQAEHLRLEHFIWD